MKFGLLGPLEVRGDDGPLPLGGAKQRAVLALLLLDANRVVARERLIDGLWGATPPETAVTIVQVYVSRLRKLLPEGRLLTRAPGYVLEVEPGEVDLLWFERLVADARGVDPGRASELLGEALALWRGPALAEFGEEPFARTDGGRLRDLRLAALEERIEADLALGRHAELVGELEALVAEQPHRERFRGQLMVALYRAGRQVDALAAYRTTRATLDELGIEPTAMLRQLERQILGQDAALDLGREARPRLTLREPLSLPGPLVPSSPFPLVGRASELAALRSLLERAEGGEGGLVLLAGEAGAGKTRLVRELAKEATARGALVCYGASDSTVSVPYQPLREWFDRVLPVLDADVLSDCLHGRGDQIARLLPELAPLTGPPAVASDEPETDRYLLQSAFIEFLKRIGRVRPLLLVADDAHWSDSETRTLLRRLARAAPAASMLIVVAFRNRGETIGDELAETIADLTRLDGVTRLALGDLSTDDVGAFIRASVDAEATAELATALHELTRGTPLLLCELWRELVDSGTVEVSHAGVRLSRPVAELRGPERIHDIVRQRLARLSPETTGMLELAAVAGPRFELRVLAAATQTDPAILRASVEDAERRGMIEELPEVSVAWRFTHELVRRAVYDRITVLRRAELHLRVGETLEQLYAADPTRVPELAHHFTRAASVGGVERAVDYNLRAAAAAVTAVAFSEAAARLASALELGIGEPRERARVEVELGYLLFETGRITESEAILTASLETGSDPQEQGLAARALVERARVRIHSDPAVDLIEMRRVVESAIATLGRVDDPPARVRAELLLAFILRAQGRVAESCYAYEHALVDATAAGDPATVREATERLVGALCEGPAPAGEAIGRCEALLQSSGGDLVLEAPLRRRLSLLLAMADRLGEARDELDKIESVFDEMSDSVRGVSRRYVAAAKELLGDRAGAEQELAGYWRQFQNAGGGAHDTRALRAATELALFYCDEGRWDDAADCLAYGQELPEPTSFRPSLVIHLAAKARLKAHRGEHAEALRLAQRAAELAAPSDMLTDRARVMLALAEVQRQSGQIVEADAAVEAALRLYEEKGNVVAAARLRAARAQPR